MITRWKLITYSFIIRIVCETNLNNGNETKNERDERKENITNILLIILFFFFDKNKTFWPWNFSELSLYFDRIMFFRLSSIIRKQQFHYYCLSHKQNWRTHWNSAMIFHLLFFLCILYLNICICVYVCGKFSVKNCWLVYYTSNST